MVIPEAGQWEEGRGLRGLHAGAWAARASSPQRCFVKCHTDVCVCSPGSRPERSSDYLEISLGLRNIKKHELSRICDEIQPGLIQGIRRRAG